MSTLQLDLLHICNGEMAPASLLFFFLKLSVPSTLLADKPDIVISTPSRALGLLQSKVRWVPIVHMLYLISIQTLNLSSLESLVIDEADLILSYGHDEDVRQIFTGGYLPKVYQSFLMSATMTDDVETLKGLALRSPVRSLSRFFCSLLTPVFRPS